MGPTGTWGFSFIQKMVEEAELNVSRVIVNPVVAEGEEDNPEAFENTNDFLYNYYHPIAKDDGPSGKVPALVITFFTRPLDLVGFIETEHYDFEGLGKTFTDNAEIISRLNILDKTEDPTLASQISVLVNLLLKEGFTFKEISNKDYLMATNDDYQEHKDIINSVDNLEDTTIPTFFLKHKEKGVSFTIQVIPDFN